MNSAELLAAVVAAVSAEQDRRPSSAVTLIHTPPTGEPQGRCPTHTRVRLNAFGDCGVCEAIIERGSLP